MTVTTAVPIAIEWNPLMPIFASEPFLKAVGEEYGWIGGVRDSGALRCILPYTIVREMGVRLVRFRVETIAQQPDFGIEEEGEFLAGAMSVLRTLGAHVVIPATTNTIFRTFPAGARAAPYGSYVVDLSQSEDELWRCIERITRQNINTAVKRGVAIGDGRERLHECWALIKSTFERSRLPFMGSDSLLRYVRGLGENGRVFVAVRGGEIESCVVYAFSQYCAYAVYGGNAANMIQGANKLLHWEAMKSFKASGVRQYDFVGARIDPDKGSKQEAINSFKRRLGGRLRCGYMWKYDLRPLGSLAYSLGVRLLRGGDIVDHERYKLATYHP